MYTKILSLCKGVSDYLQQVTSDIGHANSLVCSLIDTFKKWEKYIVDQTIQDIQLNSKDDFRIHIFFPAIDLIISELENRFGRTKPIINAVAALHPSNTLFLNFDALTPLATFYQSNLDLLKSELMIRPTTLAMYENEKNMKITTIMDLLDMLKIYKIAFIETYKLAVISAKIPVSSAACERTFSTLKRLKTCVRNSMTNERLIHLAVTNVESAVAKSLNIEDIVKEFDAAHNNRRILLH